MIPIIIPLIPVNGRRIHCSVIIKFIKISLVVMYSLKAENVTQIVQNIGRKQRRVHLWDGVNKEDNYENY